MSEQEAFEQFCVDVQEGSSIHARSKLVTLFDLISYEEFFNNFSSYDYLELISVFRKNRKDSWPRYDDLIFGFLFLITNSDEEAYHHLNRAIERDLDHYLAYYLRSMINNEINQERINDAKEAVILNPTERTVLSLGNKYFDKGKRIQNSDNPAFSRAIQCYQNSLKLNSDYVFARLQLARVFNSTYKYDMAYKELKKCREIKPAESIYYLEIARTLSQMNWRSDVSKREEKAFKFLFEGLKLDEENPLFHLELGKLFRKVDDLEKSIFHYEKYLEKLGFEIEDEDFSYGVNFIEEPLEIKSEELTLAEELEEIEVLNEHERILEKLRWLKKEKLIRDANNLLENNKINEALSLYKELIQIFMNFKVYLDYDDLKESAKYFKCKVLTKNKDLEFDFEHPKYDWLDKDKDASKYRWSKYEIHKGAKIMELINSDENRETKFSFGKYNGAELKKIVEKDLSYINWCYFNIPSFFIVDLIRIDERLRRLKDYYKLIEIHLVKADYLFQIFDEEEEDEKYIWRPTWRDAFGSEEEAFIAYWNTH